LVVTSMRNAARAIPQVWSKTFSIGIVLLEILQAVKDLGVTGYEARQTTAKVGPNITPEASAERYAVNAFGFALIAAFPKRKASLGIRYFKEFADRATFQGYSAQVSAAISF